MQIFGNLLPQKESKKFLDIARKNSLWVCVIKVCSNGGVIYIMGEIKVKDNLNLEQI